MTGWREKRREARWKRKARMRNLERINKNKKCLAAKIIWICSRLPWRRELRITPDWKWKQRKTVAFREGVSWEMQSTLERGFCGSGRLPWRRELRNFLLDDYQFERVVAFREGVSWENLSQDEAYTKMSPSVKAWVEKRVKIFLCSVIIVAFREGVSWEY